MVRFGQLKLKNMIAIADKMNDWKNLTPITAKMDAAQERVKNINNGEI